MILHHELQDYCKIGLIAERLMAFSFKDSNKKEGWVAQISRLTTLAGVMFNQTQSSRLPITFFSEHLA